jgi:hypothetical protein
MMSYTVERRASLSRFEVAGRGRPALHQKQGQLIAGCAQQFSPALATGLACISVV